MIGITALCIFVLPHLAKGFWEGLTSRPDEQKAVNPVQAGISETANSPLDGPHHSEPAQAVVPTEGSSVRNLPSTDSADPAKGAKAGAAVPVVDRLYSDEEIDEMEKERQYNGSDPIVRARLGLPSRETRKLITAEEGSEHMRQARQ